MSSLSQVKKNIKVIDALKEIRDVLQKLDCTIKMEECGYEIVISCSRFEIGVPVHYPGELNACDLGNYIGGYWENLKEEYEAAKKIMEGEGG